MSKVTRKVPVPAAAAAAAAAAGAGAGASAPRPNGAGSKRKPTIEALSQAKRRKPNVPVYDLIRDELKRVGSDNNEEKADTADGVRAMLLALRKRPIRQSFMRKKKWIHSTLEAEEYGAFVRDLKLGDGKVKWNLIIHEMCYTANLMFNAESVGYAIMELALLLRLAATTQCPPREYADVLAHCTSSTVAVATVLAGRRIGLEFGFYNSDLIRETVATRVCTSMTHGGTELRVLLPLVVGAIGESSMMLGSRDVGSAMQHVAMIRGAGNVAHSFSAFAVDYRPTLLQLPYGSAWSWTNHRELEGFVLEVNKSRKVHRARVSLLFTIPVRELWSLVVSYAFDFE